MINHYKCQEHLNRIIILNHKRKNKLCNLMTYMHIFTILWLAFCNWNVFLSLIVNKLTTKSCIYCSGTQETINIISLSKTFRYHVTNIRDIDHFNKKKIKCHNFSYMHVLFVCMYNIFHISDFNISIITNYWQKTTSYL